MKTFEQFDINKHSINSFNIDELEVRFNLINQPDFLFYYLPKNDVELIYYNKKNKSFRIKYYYFKDINDEVILFFSKHMNIDANFISFNFVENKIMSTY
ncbi:hypothetical protein M0Q50_10365 [bacterium]|jgi:hypothetical protein|nr:hypothetical protein [bacterium]